MIMPVTKSNGSVRICGDYKLPNSNFVPYLEDIYASLAGGQLAYNQVKFGNQSEIAFPPIA